MKKITLALAAISFVAFTMTSCKKTYHCECSTTILGTTTTAKGASSKLNKKDAEAAEKTCTGSNTPGLVTCTWVTE